MTSSVIGALRVTLGMDSAQFTEGLSAAQKQIRQASARLESVGTKMAGVGAAMSVAITAPFIAAGAHLLKGSQDAAAASAQVEAALTSMGGASGKTLEGLKATAEGLRNLTGVDDDEILKKVTANLLTFGDVSGGVFDRAQAAIVDISARLGTDLQSAAMMVGKALNDPVKGLSALRRTGIQFTAQQEDQIKAMVAAGNAAGAQAVMLGELERQFGGAAKAAADADIWTPMRVALMDLEGAFEPLIRSVVAPAITAIANLTKSFASLPPATIGVMAAAAAVAAALGPILIAAGMVVTAVGAIGTAFATGGFLAAVVPFLGPIALGVAGIAAAFWVFRDDIIPVLKDFGAAIQEHVGPKLAPLFDALKGMVDQLGVAFSAFFSSDSGSASKNLMAFGRVIAQVFGAAVSLITGAINTITQIMRAIGALLTGDWSTMWNALGSAVAAMTHGVLNAFRALFPGVLGYVSRMVDGVREWLGTKLNDIFGGVIKRVQSVSNAFRDLYIAVVGNSYVPDMVEETGEWMGRLQGALVDPAVRATKSTAEAFEDMRDRARAAMSDLLTDRERLDLDRAQEQKDLAGIADPRDRAEFERRAAHRYQVARNGMDAEGLTMPELPQIRGLDDDGSITRLNDTINRMKDAVAQSRDDFADAFSYGIEAAMNGDWSSVLRTLVEQIFGGTLQDALRNLGGSLFDSLGGGKASGGFDFGSIGKTVSSFFGKIPGFSTGGSFRVGGSGSVDSKLVSMRLTPGEMVDVRRPGQLQAANNNAPMHFDLRGAVMTADLLAQMQGMATQSGGNALRTARVAVPADRAKSDRYNLGRR